MQAMVLQSPHPITEKPLVLSDIPVPEPGPGQILLRVHVCGVCHTDLHTVEGELDLPKLPLTPGHQIVGAVEAFPLTEANEVLQRLKRSDIRGAAALRMP